MSSGERDEDRFPHVNAAYGGSVYVNAFEGAWVCEYEAGLGYLRRSLGPVHRPRPRSDLWTPAHRRPARPT